VKTNCGLIGDLVYIGAIFHITTTTLQVPKYANLATILCVTY